MNTLDNNSQPQPQLQPKSNSKLSWVLLAILIVLLIAGGIWYFMFQNSSNKTAANTTTTTTAPTTSSTAGTASTAIQNDAGLQTASADLDSSAPDNIDSSLSQNDTDVAQF